MKLTRPQKRVLRTMLEFETYVDFSLSERYAYYARRDLAIIPDPAVSTIHALERRGLLEAIRKWGESTFYVLTPKGREAAKELQSDEADSTTKTCLADPA